jgi:hypothetical protein
MQAEFDIGERAAGGWRGIAAAWAVVLVVLLLFAGYSAAQSAAPHRAARPAMQAVIPRHDPLCDGIGAIAAPAPEACAAAVSPYAAMGRAGISPM